MGNRGKEVYDIHGVDGGFLLDVIVPQVLIHLQEEPGSFPRICESSCAKGCEGGFEVDGIQHGGQVPGDCAHRGEGKSNWTA